MKFTELQALAKRNVEQFKNEIVEKVKLILGEKHLSPEQISAINKPIESLRNMLVEDMSEETYNGMESLQLEAMATSLRENLYRLATNTEGIAGAPTAARIVTLDDGPAPRPAQSAPKTMGLIPPIPSAPPAAACATVDFVPGARPDQATPPPRVQTPPIPTQPPQQQEMGQAPRRVPAAPTPQRGCRCSSVKCDCSCRPLNNAVSSAANCFSFFCCEAPKAAAAPAAKCCCGTVGCIGACVGVTGVAAVACLTAAATCVVGTAVLVCGCIAGCCVCAAKACSRGS